MDAQDSKEAERLCKKYPSELADMLLNHPFWHTKLELKEDYRRFDDDTRFGTIAVMFSHDADAWMQVVSEQDPDDMSFSHRFRMPLFGGGQSPRVRQALILLARAIQLDNAEHPQQRGIKND